MLEHQDLRVGDPDDPAAWASPAVVGGSRAVATRLVVGGDQPTAGVRHDARAGARAATVALVPDAWLTQAVGCDIRALGAVLA